MSGDSHRLGGAGRGRCGGAGRAGVGAAPLSWCVQWLGRAEHLARVRGQWAARHESSRYASAAPRGANGLPRYAPAVGVTSPRALAMAAGGPPPLRLWAKGTPMQGERREEVPEGLAGMTAGQGEAHLGRPLTHPTAHLEQ